MLKIMFGALGLVWMVVLASAQGLAPDELARRAIERRAIEAVNWGMSAVNTDLMLQEMLAKTAGKMNATRPVSEWSDAISVRPVIVRPRVSKTYR